MRCHLVLADTIIVDGTGSPPTSAEIGIAEGRFVAVGDHLEGERRIELDRRLLPPGFVGAHRHTDVAVWDPELTYAATAQGVTTEVVGNCGWSAFPSSPGREKAASNSAVHCSMDGTPGPSRISRRTSLDWRSTPARRTSRATSVSA